MKHVRKLTRVKVLEAVAAVDFANAVLNAYYSAVYGKKNFIIGPITDGGDDNGDDNGDDEEEEELPFRFF